MYQSVKVSAISLKPTKWDKASNAEKLEAFFVEASKDAPQLILATEGVLEGYVVMDVIEGRAAPEAMLEIAEPIDGAYIRRFRRLARQLKTCLCFGFAERCGTSSVYNSAVFIDGNGDICGTYHKTQFAEGTHPSWNFNCIGGTIRAFDTPFGRAGILICNDRWNPLIARTLVLDGAQFLLIPSYGSKGRSQNRTVLARARENGVPIVEANVGMNLIISKGEIVAYKWGNDQISTANIDIPVLPSTKAARRSEQEYLQSQGSEMDTRYRKTISRLK
jgi:predicted amidohydrolase